MKKSFSFLILIILVSLVVANVFLFYSSIKLGDEITSFESKIETIHRQNINLEKELSRLSSLAYARKLAAKLEFTKKSQPAFLEKIIYAFAPNQ